MGLKGWRRKERSPSTLARKLGDVFLSDHAALGREPSLSSGSRRVERDLDGLATA